MVPPDQASRRGWKRPFLFLLVGLTLTVGCTGLLQNIGARWATRQISEVFALDEAQQEATRAAVDRVMASAPDVLEARVGLLVATVDRALSKGLNEQNMRVIERQIDVLLDKTAAWIIDEATPILATLRDDQIDHAQRQLDERLEKTREELGKPTEERIRDRQEKFVEAIEEWTGSLNDAQEKAIRAYVAVMPDEAADGLRADERRLTEIADGLRQHPGEPAVRDLLWNAWKNREDWGPSTRSPEARRADGRKTLLFVYGLLDAEQKDHMSKRLHEVHDRVKRFLGIAGA